MTSFTAVMTADRTSILSFFFGGGKKDKVELLLSSLVAL